MTPDQARLVLETRLEEYRALRAEIVATLTAAYQTSNLTLTGAGILIAGLPLISGWERPIILLIASYLFYALSWTQLRYEQVVFNMSSHINNVIAPSVRDIVRLGLDEITVKVDSLLSWELSGRKANHPEELYFAPTEAARYGIPIFAATLSSFAYFFKAFGEGISFVEGLLFVVNLVLLWYSISATYRLRKKLQQGQPPDCQQAVVEHRITESNGAA